MVPTRVTTSQTPPEKIPLTFSLAVTDTEGARSLETPKSSISMMFKCSPTDEQIVNKVKGQIQQALGFAESFNYEHFVYGVKKWLSGDDIPLDLDVDWLRSTSLIRDSEQTNERNFERRPIGSGPNRGDSLIGTVRAVMNDGVTRQFGDFWDDPKTGLSVLPLPGRGTATNDFLFTVGSYQLTSVGSFEVSRVSSDGLFGPTIRIQGEVHHFLSQSINNVKQAFDEFNFNPGGQFPPREIARVTQPLGFPTFINNELNLMEQCEGTKDYTQQASWGSNTRCNR